MRPYAPSITVEALKRLGLDRFIHETVNFIKLGRAVASADTSIEPLLAAAYYVRVPATSYVAGCSYSLPRSKTLNDQAREQIVLEYLRGTPTALLAAVHRITGKTVLDVVRRSALTCQPRHCVHCDAVVLVSGVDQSAQNVCPSCGAEGMHDGVVPDTTDTEDETDEAEVLSEIQLTEAELNEERESWARSDEEGWYYADTDDDEVPSVD